MVLCNNSLRINDDVLIKYFVISIIRIIIIEIISFIDAIHLIYIHINYYIFVSANQIIFGFQYLLGVASKQLRLPHGRVGDSTIVVNSLSSQMSELVEDAIAS